MIALLSAAVGYVAYYLYLVVMTIALERNVTHLRAVGVGTSATLLFSALVWGKLPTDDTRIKIGWMMLSISIFLIVVALVKLVELTTDLMSLRILTDRVRR